MPNYNFLTGKSATQGLYHFDNAYTDSSYFGRTLSHSGASFNSTTKKFGSYSMLLNAVGYAAFLSGFSWPNDQWTIEFWLSCSDPGANSVIFEALSSGGQGFVIVYERNESVIFFNAITSVGTYSGLASTFPFGGTFHHYAMVKVSATQIIGFYDGSALSVPIPTISGTIATSTSIGLGMASSYSYGGYTFNQTLAGFYDEMRFSSTARWTSAFTPPTAAYVY